MVLSWRRFRERATAVLHLDEEPSRLAAGMATGVFIGVTPFYGLHTLLALVVAYVFRLNKAATITGAWLNLPWFAPFVYAFCLRLGEAVSDRRLEQLLAGQHPRPGRIPRGSSPRETAGTLYQMVWDMLFVRLDAPVRGDDPRRPGARRGRLLHHARGRPRRPAAPRPDAPVARARGGSRRGGRSATP